ncbi:IS66 family insertion sequence element accessory protein TnpA [Alicyclobacillus ferrooxydans]|uniref:Transposase n=1 Tax=Alicyclobacillus ferrooxydans TaxID=471514 RepID=A0A0P9CDX5_9BACL|nr:hypothetical protein [Alicyclobacillus ferrooxydans]KPV43987.1 hypothetical protein AN477_09740 [Alicyclobacillus ferrooxydans]
MSREEVQLQWKARVDEFRESGQTAAEWCRVHSLNVNQFRRWIHKFPKQGTAESPSPTIRWLSVTTEDPTTTIATGPAITIHVGSASIEVQDGFNPTLLKQVVHALAE